MRAAALAMLAVASSAFASDARPNQVFEPGSLAQLPSEFKATGNGAWAIKDGKLKGIAAEQFAHSTLMLGQAAIKDVAVEVDVAFASVRDSSRWFAIVVRDGGDASPGVQFAVRQDATRANGLEIATIQPSPASGWRVLRTARAAAAFRIGQTYRMRIEAVGGWIRGYVDDQLVIRAYRGQEFAQPGQIGLRVSGATVMIERIKTAPLSAADDADARPIRTRPLVVAHRGLSWVAPENTLAAYRLAIEAGADMAECDVYITKDGVPVLMHDRTLERTAGRKDRLRNMTLAEVKRLDAGRWKGPQFAGECIPTLVEALELTRGKLRFVIEIKEEGIAPQVLKAIQASEVAPQDLMIFSFYDKAVEEIARLEPRLPTTWLVDDPGIDRSAWREAISNALRIRASAIGTSITHVDPGFVRLAHECGLSVFVWTVNDPADVRFLVDIGVDAIISDRPDMVLELLAGCRNADAGR